MTRDGRNRRQRRQTGLGVKHNGNCSHPDAAAMLRREEDRGDMVRSYYLCRLCGHKWFVDNPNWGK